MCLLYFYFYIYWYYYVFGYKFLYTDRVTELYFRYSNFLNYFSLSYCFSVRLLHFQNTLLRVSTGNLCLFFMLDWKVEIRWLAVLRLHRHSDRTFIVGRPVVTSLQTKIFVNCIDHILVQVILPDVVLEYCITVSRDLLLYWEKLLYD